MDNTLKIMMPEARELTLVSLVPFKNLFIKWLSKYFPALKQKKILKSYKVQPYSYGMDQKLTNKYLEYMQVCLKIDNTNYNEMKDKTFGPMAEMIMIVLPDLTIEYLQSLDANVFAQIFDFVAEPILDQFKKKLAAMETLTGQVPAQR